MVVKAWDITQLGLTTQLHQIFSSLPSFQKLYLNGTISKLISDNLLLWISLSLNYLLSIHPPNRYLFMMPQIVVLFPLHIILWCVVGSTMLRISICIYFINFYKYIQMDDWVANPILNPNLNSFFLGTLPLHDYAIDWKMAVSVLEIDHSAVLPLRLRLRLS